MGVKEGVFQRIRAIEGGVIFVATLDSDDNAGIQAWRKNDLSFSYEGGAPRDAIELAAGTGNDLYSFNLDHDSAAPDQIHIMKFDKDTLNFQSQTTLTPVDVGEPDDENNVFSEPLTTSPDGLFVGGYGYLSSGGDSVLGVYVFDGASMTVARSTQVDSRTDVDTRPIRQPAICDGDHVFIGYFYGINGSSDWSFFLDKIDYQTLSRAGQINLPDFLDDQFFSEAVRYTFAPNGDVICALDIESPSLIRLYRIDTASMVVTNTLDFQKTDAVEGVIDLKADSNGRIFMLHRRDAPFGDPDQYLTALDSSFNELWSDAAPGDNTLDADSVAVYVEGSAVEKRSGSDGSQLAINTITESIQAISLDTPYVQRLGIGTAS